MAINRFTIDASVQQETGNIFDETVCGLIFDTSKRGNIFSGYSLAQAKYENEQVQRLTSMDDVVASGITEDGIMRAVFLITTSTISSHWQRRTTQSM